MGSESIAHEGERNNCFSKIQLVGQNFNLFLPLKILRFSLLVGYNIYPSSSSTNQNAALIIDR